MKKFLTKEQKKREVIRHIKHEIKNDITKVLLRKVDKIFASGAVGEDLMEQGNHLLSKALIDSFCRERPYGPLSKLSKKEFDNIHLMS